jgi:flagellar protein FliS
MRQACDWSKHGPPLADEIIEPFNQESSFMQTVASAYLESQASTASPERLHLMVVDAAIRFARKGEAALAEKNYESAYFALDRSRSCVSELLGGISPEPNPQLAESLKALFVFVHASLTRADIEHNPEPVRDALAILETHRQTWVSLIESLVDERSSRQTDQPVAAGENSWTT